MSRPIGFLQSLLAGRGDALRGVPTWTVARVPEAVLCGQKHLKRVGVPSPTCRVLRGCRRELRRAARSVSSAQPSPARFEETCEASTRLCPQTLRGCCLPHSLPLGGEGGYRPKRGVPLLPHVRPNLMSFCSFSVQYVVEMVMPDLTALEARKPGTASPVAWAHCGRNLLSGWAKEITLSGGSLGSCVDEERSQLRELV